MFTFNTLIFLVFLIFVFLSIRKAQEGKRIFDYEDSLALRGIFAVCIIVFHISKESDLLYPLFHYLSIVSIGIFYFLSGYGLMKGYLKDRDYEKTYLIKRFRKLILPYLVITLVYWLYNFLTGNRFGFLYVVQAFLDRSPIVSYSWFIVSLICQYLYFYLIMILSRRNEKIFFSLVAVLSAIRFIWAFVIHDDFSTLLDFVFTSGILYTRFEGRCETFLRRNGVKILIPLLIAAVGLVFLSDRIDGTLYVLVQRLAFVTMIACFLSRYCFRNKFLSFLGKISMEIYLLQGLSKMIVRRFFGAPLFFQDMAIYVLCFALSVLFYRLFSGRKANA